MSVDEEFCKYLKSGSFEGFMSAWKKQYERLGHLGGTIHVPLDDESRIQIGELLGKDYHGQSHVRIAWSQLKKAILQTKYDEADFTQVLKLYFKENIISKKSREELRRSFIQEELRKMLETYADTKAGEWLKAVLEEQDVVYMRMGQEIEKRCSVFNRELNYVMKAINELPMWYSKKESMAIFSSNISGDPHAFDSGNFMFYLLMQALCFLLKEENRKLSKIDENIILYKAGLYRDSINNFCVLAHINAYQKEDKIHYGWKGFYDNYEVLSVNVENLQHVERIDATSCKVVVVIENPSVFQALVETAKESALENIGFVCTGGQLNYSAYVLLDMIYESKISMYYCGDMDPEGLLIADKLKKRYRNALTLWHYSSDDYFKSVSDNCLSKRRIVMMEQIENKELKEIADCLTDGTIGYQENLLEVYKKDLMSMVHEA